MSRASGTTDSSGTASTTLNAGNQEGTASITTIADVVVDLGGRNTVTAPLSKTVNVEISANQSENSETWTGTVTYDITGKDSA